MFVFGLAKHSWDKDLGVDEWHGHNVVIHNGNRIFCTTSSTNRGDEAFGTVWSYLGVTPLGRQWTVRMSPTPRCGENPSIRRRMAAFANPAKIESPTRCLSGS
ncbi:hypothetical protein DPM33_13650 [Mesorhizobium hawassense]|uniref:Uncharacterized protein n=1 Tax=Mesorhizobium hawassense TaxID=1209954 RepID=A0A330HQQ7_9HYPH|nr:hypothetical protein DPM33_13650 [Mesorhizobium hawassense]